MSAADLSMSRGSSRHTVDDDWQDADNLDRSDVAAYLNSQQEDLQKQILLETSNSKSKQRLNSLSNPSLGAGGMSGGSSTPSSRGPTPPPSAGWTLGMSEIKSRSRSPTLVVSAPSAPSQNSSTPSHTSGDKRSRSGESGTNDEIFVNQVGFEVGPGPPLLHTESAASLNDLLTSPNDGERKVSSAPQSEATPGSQRRSPAATPAFKKSIKNRNISTTSNASGGNRPSGSETPNSDKRYKRKSWINNALNPTYKSRSDDLKRNFPSLPPEETLIVDYSCALQKDILVHGRLYVTTNCLCFYANIFRWETAVTIKWREVTAMTKEKTALVIPNAIQICTGHEKFFFTSFTARDKTHMMLFRLWQNALLDSPASHAEIWTWVHSVYGEKSMPDSDNEGSAEAGSSYSFDGLDGDQSSTRPRLYSNIAEGDEEDKLPINAGSFLPDRVGDRPMLSINNNASLDSLATDQSDTTESDPAKGTSLDIDPVLDNASSLVDLTSMLTFQAWRQDKEGREMLTKCFSINIDELFTLLFTNSKFFYDFQAERNTFDIVQCPWQQKDNSEDKFRKVSFTLNLNHPMGPKTSRATETQTMHSVSVPGQIYSVEVETINADIPYADNFYVMSHFCIVKVNDGETRLTVVSDIKYRKAPWGIVKSFLEKNCWAGLEDHYLALGVALEAEVEGALSKNQDVSNKKKTRRARKSNVRRAQSSSTYPSTTTAPILSSQNVVRNKRHVQSPRNQDYQNSFIGPLLLPSLLTALFVLALLNILLFYKMWCLESRLLSKEEISEADLNIQLRRHLEGPRYTTDWVRLLQRQEVLHNKEMESWHVAVNEAVDLLHKAETSIGKLTQVFQVDGDKRLLNQLSDMDLKMAMHATNTVYDQQQMDSAKHVPEESHPGPGSREGNTF